VFNGNGTYRGEPGMPSIGQLEVRNPSSPQSMIDKMASNHESWIKPQEEAKVLERAIQESNDGRVEPDPIFTPIAEQLGYHTHEDCHETSVLKEDLLDIERANDQIMPSYHGARHSRASIPFTVDTQLQDDGYPDDDGIYLVLQTVNSIRFPEGSSTDNELFLTVHEQIGTGSTQRSEILDPVSYKVDQNSDFTQVEDLSFSNSTEVHSNLGYGFSYPSKQGPKGKDPHCCDLLERSLYSEPQGTPFTALKTLDDGQARGSFACSWNSDKRTKAAVSQLSGVPVTSEKPGTRPEIGPYMGPSQINRRCSTHKQLNSAPGSSPLIYVPTTVSDLMRRDLEMHSVDRTSPDNNKFTKPIGITTTNAAIRDWSLRKFPEVPASKAPHSSTNFQTSIKARIAMFEQKHSQDSTNSHVTSDKITAVKLPTILTIMNVVDDDDDFLYGAPTQGTTATTVISSSNKESRSKEIINSPPKDDEDENDEEEEDMDEEDSEDVRKQPFTPIQTDVRGSPKIGHFKLKHTQTTAEWTTNEKYKLHNWYDACSPRGAFILTFNPAQTAPNTLTTEYQPLERDSSTIKKPTPNPPITEPTPVVHAPVTQPEVVAQKPNIPEVPEVDPSTLPVAIAPDSAPNIDLNREGLLDGRSVYEVDIAALENKAWRRPGADLSDWFNYGFDEISWEAYAARRRDLGEMAPILKANVLTFSGLSEEQIQSMPTDLRGMAMVGSHLASTSMGGGGPNMMPNGVPGMNQDMMMNMGMMGGMQGGMVPVGTGDMNQGGQQMMGQGMNEGEGPPNGPGMMQGMEYTVGGVGMGMEYAQDQNIMPPNVGPGFPMDNQAGGPPNRGASFRGRVQPTAPRGRGVPAFRGRGRGPRAASPLPPNVPTGPRNQHRYKDRDTGVPTSEPLDYGGDGGAKPLEKGLRDEFGRDIDRGSKDDDPSKSTRKRRGSPPEDIGRSKRR
ncbi:1982_t:CDS:2, partial [Acaulospora colombiana]